MESTGSRWNKGNILDASATSNGRGRCPENVAKGFRADLTMAQVQNDHRERAESLWPTGCTQWNCEPTKTRSFRGPYLLLCKLPMAVPACLRERRRRFWKATAARSGIDVADSTHAITDSSRHPRRHLSFRKPQWNGSLNRNRPAKYAAPIDRHPAPRDTVRGRAKEDVRT